MRHRSGFVRRLVAVVVVGAFAIAACSSDESASSKRPKPTPSTTTTVPVPTAPFTGLPDPDGVANARSSVAVKIENAPEARPQSGLDVADIVYEEVVEGGITRFWAVFNSNAPENIGPVRSVRAMDPNIVKPLGGVVAYSGGTTPNVALLRATGLVWVDENNAGDAFFREPSRSSPHNLYARSALLFQRGGQPVPPGSAFSFLDEGATFSGEPVAQFHANFDQGYDMTYVWDAVGGGWKRFQRTDESFMAAGSAFTLRQVAPTNVIIQFISYPRGAEGELIGSGDAWFFSNGQLVRGRWERAFQGAHTTFLDASGAPILLTPGRTWVELLPVGRTVDVVPGVPPSTTTSTTSAKTSAKGKHKP